MEFHIIMVQRTDKGMVLGGRTTYPTRAAAARKVKGYKEVQRHGRTYYVYVQ